MDSDERIRHYLGERSSPPAQHIGRPGIIPDASNGNNNYNTNGLVHPISRSSPNHINRSPNRSPGLILPPPGLTHVPHQFAGYPVFDNTPGVYPPAPPGYFFPPQSGPIMQGNFGEIDNVFPYTNMGMPIPPPQEHVESRFPPYNIGRKMSAEEKLMDSMNKNMNEGNRVSPREQVIENIVGALGGSSAGTYTHFGPMNPFVVGLGVRNNNNNNSELERFQQQQMQKQREVEFNQAMEAQQLQMNVTPQNMKMKSSGLGDVMKSNGMAREMFSPSNPNATKSVIGSGKLSPVTVETGNGGQVPRSLTPNGTSYSSYLKEQGVADSSSPKLPVSSGKPSYLEILTKNNSVNATNPSFRRTSSSSSTEQNQSSVSSSGDSELNLTGSKRDSPTPTSNSNGHHIQPLLQFHNQGAGMPHRKSSDGFVVLNSSPGTSNSSTASSSPITKPKTQQKGKENYATGLIKTSKTSLPCNGTPTKNVKAQNNATTGNGKKIGSGKAFKTQKFDFEIDDADDDEEDGDGVDEPEPEVDEKSSKKKGKERKGSVTLANGNGSLGKNGVEKYSSSGSFGFGFQFGRKSGRERAEKPRSRKEERNCLVRRLRVTSKQWLGHLISALTWFWSLVLNVCTLSAAVGYGLTADLGVWWRTRALPWLRVKNNIVVTQAKSLWQKLKWKEWTYFKRKEPQKKTEEIEDLSDLLAMLGPERNIVLPATGEDALRRLQSVKGQDPYSILGVRSNSPDETIRRYYKKQAVLVHPDKNLVPGAEEAFKILARAFELVGEPVRRMEYHKQLLEAHAKERFMGEFGSLFEQLRKKLESACTTIRCTKCNARHKKNKTNRPLFAARYCSQCRIHHGAREGELWAEKGGFFGFWTYYACMGNQVWEINEWGKCQSESLKQLNANSHNVLYRLVSGGQGQRQSRNSSHVSSTGPSEEDLLDPEIDDWDNLINNLCRGAGGSSGGGSSGGAASSTSATHKGSNTSNAHGNGHAANSTVPNGSAPGAVGRKRKCKRK